ncbi:uncharacterized protein LOC121399786 [Xenopus laevis]|uniref:Uncharacterized protein LOC121399786 n=2 Tax=Xenopus laevis TaxID=8355 RepID=A0A1L8HBQ6_XENLA|nr:uncharacterized protein LOC121399786 [Xenopus laevis]OCT93522.1 hypothetical protein XELAEV_18011200mg [Xenopus laevis]
MGPHRLMCTLLTAQILTVSCGPHNMSSAPPIATQEANTSMSIINRISQDKDPATREQNLSQRTSPLCPENDNWYTKPEILISAVAGAGGLLLISIVLCITSCCLCRRSQRLGHQEWNPMELNPLSPENHELPSLTLPKKDTCAELTSPPETGVSAMKICTSKTDVENCTSNADLENCTSNSENTAEEVDAPDEPEPCYPPPPEPFTM